MVSPRVKRYAAALSDAPHQWAAVSFIAAALLGALFFTSPEGKGVFANASRDYGATVFGCLFGDCSFDPLNYQPNCTISASPNTVLSGGAATLSWSSNIFSPYLVPVNQTVAASGAATVAPTQTTTYNLQDNASAYGGMRNFYYGIFGIPSPVPYCAVTVQVSPAPVPPSCTLNANPSFITNGQQSTLSYVISGSPSSASISPSVGTVALNPPSTYNVAPTTTTTYTLMVNSQSGQSFCQRTVSVDQPQTPTLYLYASPNRVVQGSATSLTWSTQYVTSCSVTNSGGEVIATGVNSPTPAPRVTINSPTAFTLSCSTPQGQAVASASVTVGIQPIYVEI